MVTGLQKQHNFRPITGMQASRGGEGDAKRVAKPWPRRHECLTLAHDGRERESRLLAAARELAERRKHECGQMDWLAGRK